MHPSIYIKYSYIQDLISDSEKKWLILESIEFLLDNRLLEKRIEKLFFQSFSTIRLVYRKSDIRDEFKLFIKTIIISHSSLVWSNLSIGKCVNRKIYKFLIYG